MPQPLKDAFLKVTPDVQKLKTMASAPPPNDPGYPELTARLVEQFLATP